MSWLSRLFGRQPAAPPPPPTTVVVPDDLAASLAGDDATLQETVEQVLRAHLAVRDAPPPPEPERLPFWLRRESEDGGELEDALRDRVAQRRTEEGERGSQAKDPTGAA